MNLTWLLIFLTLFGGDGHFPSLAQIKKKYISSDRIFLDRHGEILQKERVDFKKRNTTWVALDQIPESLLEQVIKEEDQRFYFHKGFDFLAVPKALRDIFSGRPRGLSTISMQTVRLLKNQRARTWKEKLREIYLSFQLEKSWSKNQILEAYLNLAPFGGEGQGLGAASLGYFQKIPQALNEWEGLALVLRLQDPPVTTSHWIKRFCLREDRLQHKVDCQSLPWPKNFVGEGFRLSHAPQISAFLKGEKKSTGLVRTTLDLSLQRQGVKILESHLHSIEERGADDAAMIVVHVPTGEILVYIGNRGLKSQARYVDAAQSLRQVGSTLKPFIYALAFENKLYHLMSLISDEPFEVAVGGGLYKPKNYDKRYRGSVPLIEALPSSLNIPAVRLIEQVGVDTVIHLLHSMGVERTEASDHYGPSLALGTMDLTLFDLVQAYLVLANSGISQKVFMFQDEKTPSSPNSVLSSESVALVNFALSNHEARRLAFGAESDLDTPYWSAVKTGTSQDMRDNWCLGFSKEYLVGVWVGSMGGSPMRHVSGMTGAAPIWREMMDVLHETQATDSVAPKKLSTLIYRKMEPYGEVPFIQGTEPTLESLRADVPTLVVPNILSPTDGAIYALDPGIAKASQKILFEGQAPGPFRWRVNSQDVAPSKEKLMWSPVRGPHTIQIVDARDRVLDEVKINVK